MPDSLSGEGQANEQDTEATAGAADTDSSIESGEVEAAEDPAAQAPSTISRVRSNRNINGQSSQAGSQADQVPRQGSGGLLGRLSLGGAILAVDALNERMERVEQVELEQDLNARSLDSVLVPRSEWEVRFGESPGLAARHLAIGVMVDTRSRLDRGLGYLNTIGNATVNMLGLVLTPLSKSWLLRPIRQGFNASVARGEEQVNYWMNLGRIEDNRSRVLAETAINQTMDESLDDIVENERIQEFVQEMMAAQSMGIVDEAIEEIRERAVSSDTFFENPFRRLFRRPPRSTVPGPGFDLHLIRPVSQRAIAHEEESMLGYYAGFTSRLLAVAIDIALILLFMSMTGWLIQTAGRLLSESAILDSFTLSENTVNFFSLAISSLNAFTVIIAYAFIFWILTGQTPGMMLIGIRVVTGEGGRLTFWRAAARLIGYVISVAALFLGFFWVLIDDRRQGWHDKIAGTYVVYSWEAHPDETFLTMHM